MATGLGSVDLSQLIGLWKSTNFANTTSALTASVGSDSPSSAPISVEHGTPINFTTAVTPGDATGQFSLVATGNPTAASFSDFGSLDGTGTGYLTTTDLPGGTYTVYAYYAGDTTGVNGGQPGVYGTLGTPASTNTPGARIGAAPWIDASGNLWFFGGQGYDSTGSQGYLNDLWKYQP